MSLYTGAHRLDPRLLVQTLAIIAGCELGIMFLLPVLLPESPRWFEAAADTLLLTLTAGPLLWWYFSRRLGKAEAAPKPAEMASSIRRVRIAGIAGLICIGVLAAGGTASWERLARTNETKATLVDKTGWLRWTGQHLAKTAVLHTLEPSPDRRMAFKAALAQYETAANDAWNYGNSGKRGLPLDPQTVRCWGEARAAVEDAIAAARKNVRAFDEGRTDRTALNELVTATSTAVDRVNALNRSVTASSPAGTATLKLAGRGLAVTLLTALVLVWLLAIGPAVQRAAQAEETLRRERALLGSILDCNPDGIIAADGDGNIRLFNPSVERMLGYGPEELVGQPVETIIPERLREAHRQSFGRLVAGGEPRLIGKPLELSALRRDGGEVPVELTLGMAQHGKDVLFAAALRDITERLAMLRTLRRTRDHAQAVNADLVALNETHAALFACRTIPDVARVLTDVLVREFDAHFARVWLRRPADLCGQCALAEHCPAKQECLHLVASSGFYTHLDGSHRRVPLGAFKIGLVAEGRGKTISRDVVNDQRIHDRQWAAEHGLRSFVGLPLERDGRVVGVMAMFSQADLPDHVLETLDILAQLGAAAIANVELIDSLQAATEAAERDACTDKLTGLPNRALLRSHLQHAIERVKRLRDYHFAVMFFDLDRFKIINDSFGHEFGDTLLRAVAARLRENLRATDSISREAGGATVARLGGDEFVVVLLDGIKKPEDAGAVADRLLKDLNAPYRLGEREVRLSASIGIVCSNAEYDQAEEMLRDADIAMYQAKARGKACFVMFDVAMQVAVLRRLEIENDLRAAIGGDQFFLVYQPVVSLEDGELRGVEVLVRWNHPTRGLIPPDEFIPIAEETRLILPLGNWILEQACSQFVEWRRQAPDAAPPFISVNLSRVQLADPGLVEQIVQTVQRAGMEPGRLLLEVTEGMIMKNPQEAKAALGALKAAGIRVAMDDFGTGHSSLSCLREFPFDMLKIDRSFILNLERGEEFVTLTQAVVALAENLGLECVAEGVEHYEQVAALLAMGCKYAQGYYFAKPLSAEALIDDPWRDGWAEEKKGSELLLL